MYRKLTSLLCLTASRPMQNFVVKYIRLLVLLLGLIHLFILLIPMPKFVVRECPNIYGFPIAPSLIGENIIHSNQTIDCAAIIAGNPIEISKGMLYAKCSPRDSISDNQYMHMTKDCDSFIKTRNYLADPVTKEEADFPIAFSILMFENVEQTERLLRAVYRPQNFYCIHVDSKSQESVFQALVSIAGCLPNVFIASERIDVTWAWFPVLEAEIICMRDLLRRSTSWKYFINLTGREFPLRTNLELVQILKAYRGGNDVDGTLWRRPVIWTKYHWRSENWQSWQEKAPAPHGYNVAKGSTHVAATRAFVHFAVYNQTAIDLLNWMRDIRSPDEHFFPTLNHNPQLGVPGAYTENPDFKKFLTRYKVWETVEAVCSGKWFRFICNFGVGDLKSLTSARELFANKFRYEFDPVAFSCMEQWHHNRSQQGVATDFNLSFYQNQPWVKHHL